MPLDSSWGKEQRQYGIMNLMTWNKSDRRATLQLLTLSGYAYYARMNFTTEEELGLKVRL
jgi:hypothetical protein